MILEGEDLREYGADRAVGDWPIAPLGIAFPRSVSEVQEVVRACAAAEVPIVPSGGRTGLAGGAAATSGELVLSLSKMRRIHGVDETARLLRCQAGATLASVQEAAAEKGLLYPIDFAASGSAQVGGSIATNAGGVHVVRYGSTRAWVQGLQVVTAGGELLALDRELVKDNAGFDLRQLFVGSEGTLGIIVEACLQLTKPPAAVAVALCAAVDAERVMSFFERARASELVLQAFEVFEGRCTERVLHARRAAGRAASESPFSPLPPWLVLVECEGRDEEAAREGLAAELVRAGEAGEIEDVRLAATAEQARALWELREEISDTLSSSTPYKADISVPLPHIVDFIDRFRARVAAGLPGVEALIFGHVGDGNLHLNLLCPASEAQADFLERCRGFEAELFGLVAACGGSISAEHGVGLLKRDLLDYTRSSAEIDTMRAVKTALDPNGLFNPGKVLPL